MINPFAQLQIAIQWDFPITFEMASAYQKANGKYLRQNQWEDITSDEKSQDLFLKIFILTTKLR
ncbi:hypothetical protein DW017_06710 [Ruminococcus sp. AF37-3AC]|nr:hypothetical protein DW017_06710 [Ruminococcus sp. AF37-3AC]